MRSLIIILFATSLCHWPSAGLSVAAPAEQKPAGGKQSSESSPGSGVITGDRLELVGGYKVPRLVPGVEGNVRYASGGIDYAQGKWIANRGLSSNIIEYLEAAPMGTAQDASDWPDFGIGRHAAVFDDVPKIGPMGVAWLDDDRVVCSGRKSYRSGFEPRWMAIKNLATGEEELLSLQNPGWDTSGTGDNFHLHQAFGGGFCRIPQAFANQYTGGRTLGIGRGGYDVLASPLGPALAAFDLSDPWPQRVLLDYPYQKGVAPRDPHYQFPDSKLANLPMWKSPEGDQGFWIAGECSDPAWVPGLGLVTVATTVQGTIDYRAQGDWGSAGYFGVGNPEFFYNPDNIDQGGNRGDHKSEPENMTLPAAEIIRVLYFIPESQLAEVAQGTRAPWECVPVRSDFPKDGLNWSDDRPTLSDVAGLVWDAERGLLWACIRNIYHKNKAPVVAAYRIEGED